jgi:putative hemolysin
MSKNLILSLIIIVGLLIVINPFKSKQKSEIPTSTSEMNTESTVTKEEPQANMPNPASKYCEENGGTLELITNTDGSQFGMCKFADYSCEEWVYFKKECTIDEDADKIKQALIAKGLNLTGMKVTIHKHLGRFISGGVIPVSGLGGGGYVFAAKENDEIKIVADGNGVIMCTMLEEYPDYPAYLISECVDETGNLIQR